MIDAKQQERRQWRASKAQALVHKGIGLTERFAVLQHWQTWGVVFVTCAGLLGTCSYQALFHQPTKLSCQNVFWPFASASLRLYCAQERARKNTLEDLFAAIALVDPLDRNHPLRPAINPQIELWSEKALNLAAEAFHEGKLERAIEFARRIPAQTAAAKLVKDRIEQWQKIWAEGEGIFGEAEATLKAEQWRKAFWIMVKLLKVNNRYWSETQYEALNKRILQAQRDEQEIAEARSLMRRGDLDNLAKALGKIQDLSPKSVFQASAKRTLNDISERLYQLAERALKRNDLTTALDAAQLVPRQAKIWRKAQDFEDLAYASASAWSGTIVGLEEAIKDLGKIKPDSPLYEQAQALVLKWQGQIANIRYAQQNPVVPESNYPAFFEPPSYAASVPAPAPSRSATEESSDLQTAVLDEADGLSLQGDSQSLQAAIDLASSVLPGQSSYEEAQARVAEWKVQLERLQASDNDASLVPEDLPERSPATEAAPEAGLLEEAQLVATQGTEESLIIAIQSANQVPKTSPLRFKAQQLVEAWSEQVLNLARRKAPTNLERAIAIAQRIPPYSPVHEAAQIQIRDWKARQR